MEQKNPIITVYAWSIDLKGQEPRGLYIHFPFCKKRCKYCDFTTSDSHPHLIPEYVKAVLQEISQRKDEGPFIDSIYFGGGTPSLLSPEQIRMVLHRIQSEFLVSDNAEITLEMNPEDGIPVKEFRQAGINRFSVGVQTLNPEKRRLLGRSGTASSCLQPLKNLKGFEMSADLIYALPGRSSAYFFHSLKRLLKLKPGHLSLYELSLHPGTELYEDLNGHTGRTDQEINREYLHACRILSARGYHHYEISNFALPGLESRHNLHYWHYDNTIGIGVSAAGKKNSYRYQNTVKITDYISRIKDKKSPEKICVPLDPLTRIKEYLMMNLRLDHGTAYQDLLEKTGICPGPEFKHEIGILCTQGFLEERDHRFFIPEKKFPVSNGVIRRLFDSLEKEKADFI